MGGCEVFISANRIYVYLITWINIHLKQLNPKYSVCTRISYVNNHRTTFSQYIDEVMPNDKTPHQKSIHYAYSTMC